MQLLRKKLVQLVGVWALAHRKGAPKRLSNTCPPSGLVAWGAWKSHLTCCTRGRVEIMRTKLWGNPVYIQPTNTSLPPLPLFQACNHAGWPARESFGFGLSTRPEQELCALALPCDRLCWMCAMSCFKYQWTEVC